MAEDAFKDCNPEQAEAIASTEGYVRVVAGAGSGKTRALSRRFAYLVNELGVMPGNILCVTFSNKSANEMRTRIRNLTGDNDTGLVDTFHGFCAGVLREDGYALRLPKNFPILDNSDIDTLLRTIYAERSLTMRDSTFANARDAFEIRKTLVEPGYAALVLDNPIEVLKRKYDESTARADILFYGYLYHARKCFALDYNDLILFTLRLFEANPDIRAKWQDRLEYIMVDEFQDIDPLQYRLLEVLQARHRNLFVVGDPDQTIYTWRGADVRFLLDFDKKFAPAQTIVMARNYRSSPEILSAVNSLISKNTVRIRKDLVATRESGPRVLCNLAARPDAEAALIAATMKSLHERESVPFASMAVLYRAHYVTREIETALARAEISYTIYSGVQFFDRAEVKDALSYLRLVSSRDDLAFLRVANTPRRNIGTSRISFLKEFAEENKCSLYEALERSIDSEIFSDTRARDLLRLVESHAADAAAGMPVSELLASLIDKSGYEDMLRTEGSQARLDNLAELKQSVADFETSCGEEVSAADYLAHVALFTNRDIDGGGDRVKLMTVHTAKGLEFPYVFLCSMNEGIFPSKKTETREQMEEERRLAFVAMTRAMRGLFVSASGGRNFDGSPRYPSRFILDIDPPLFDYVEPPPETLVKDTRTHMAAVDAGLDRKTQDASAAADALAVGTRVRHKVFGDGVIEAVDSEKLSYRIKFDSLPTSRTLSFRTPIQAV